MMVPSTDDLIALRSDLTAAASSMGMRTFGVADLDAVHTEAPQFLELVPGSYLRAVVLGVQLQPAVLEDIEDQPTPLYFHHYRQLNYALDRAAVGLADILLARGYDALAIPASQIITAKPMRGHVSHKLLARWAGLGFTGRSTLLIDPVYGARMRYVSILTDAALAADTPCSSDCGDCRACIATCPAAAIKESAADFDLDACYSKLTEFTRVSYVGQHICGICLKACPGIRSGSRGRVRKERHVSCT